MIMSERIIWRKQVKKLQRKRRRQRAAQEREAKEQSSPSYQSRLAQQLIQERIDEEEEARIRQQQQQNWLEADRESVRKWQEEKILRDEQTEQKRLELEKIRNEWKKTQEELQRKKEEERRVKEEVARREQEAVERIELFLAEGGEIPEELRNKVETNPGRELCPFFSKVAACRFGPTCSRNHVIPGISRLLLIPNFYAHFSLSQNKPAEYDTDVNLEYEEKEMYKDFVDFFKDVVAELDAFGQLVIVQVCRNFEPHLRGNLYVEYSDEREALLAARRLHARWYGGRQLSVRFADISDWSAAICGDFFRERCPKGKTCNFLHVFRNPRGVLRPITVRKNTNESERHWRWSESPERTPRKSKKHSREKKTHRSKDRHRDRKRNS